MFGCDKNVGVPMIFCNTVCSWDVGCSVRVLWRAIILSTAVELDKSISSVHRIACQNFHGAYAYR